MMRHRPSTADFRNVNKASPEASNDSKPKSPSRSRTVNWKTTRRVSVGGVLDESTPDETVSNTVTRHDHRFDTLHAVRVEVNEEKVRIEKFLVHVKVTLFVGVLEVLEHVVR